MKNKTFESLAHDAAITSIDHLTAQELKEVLNAASDRLMKIQDMYENAIRTAIAAAIDAGLTVNFTDYRMNNTVTITPEENHYYIDVE